MGCLGRDVPRCPADCSLGLLRPGTLWMSGKGCPGMSLEVPGCSRGLLRPRTLGCLGKDIPGMSWEVTNCSLGLLRPGTFGHMHTRARVDLVCDYYTGVRFI